MSSPAATPLKLVTFAALLAGCGASTPRPTTPPPREIVVEDGEVVQVQRPGTLPPLPRPLASTSPAFQRGYAQAQELLAATGPGTAPPQGADAADAWIQNEFQPWFERRQLAIIALVDTFAQMAGPGASEPANEHVVAVALVGLVAGRLYDQLIAVPPPPDLERDERLARIYRSELQATVQGVLEQSIMTHRRCAEAAAQQSDPSFGPWLELCHAELAKRQQQQADAAALRATVTAEREAERRAAEGERPPGPEICWTPATPAPAVPAETAGAPAAAEPAPATTPPAAAAPAPPAASCALPADAPDPLAGQPQSPRDLRYGARDAATSVRTSAALKDNPTMDARPLAWLVTQTRLAACFAKHVPADKPVTVAVHANLSVDARGRTRSVTLAPEPSDAAAAPSKALERCLTRALEQTAFTCSPSGQATQARASYCLRRD